MLLAHWNVEGVHFAWFDLRGNGKDCSPQHQSHQL
jgi:hypothetical protein